jgi:hypothetical protein
LNPDSALISRLCQRATDISGNFNPQNVANLMWAVATLGLEPDAVLISNMCGRAATISGDFNPQDVTNLMWALAKLGLNCASALISRMCERATAISGDFNAQNVANLMWSLVTLGLNPDAVLCSRMCKRAAAISGDFNPQDVANLMWALATLGLNPDAVLISRIFKRSAAISGDFNPQDVANLMWALAKLGLNPDAVLISRMCERSAAILGDFNAQNISILMWAFATLGLNPDAVLISRMCKRAGAISGDFTPQNISILMWALAKLGLDTDTVLISRMCERAGAISGDFKPQEVVNMMWALATLGLNPDSALSSRMCERATVISGDFSSQNISNLMWALAKLGLDPNTMLISRMCERASAILGDFNAQNVANLMWALAKLGLNPNVSIISSMCERASEISGDFKPQNIANLMWALAKLGLNPVSLIPRMCERAGSISGDFNAQNVANLMWALAKLGLNLDAQFLSRMCERATAISGDFNAQNVANLMWALATLGLNLEMVLISSMCMRAAAISGDFNPQGVSNLMWAFAKLELQHDLVLIPRICKRAAVISGNFNSQNISLLMWALAKLGLDPVPELILSMCERAAAISGDFNAQDVANLTWALAKFDFNPGSELATKMCEQACSVLGDLIPQNVAKLMWSLSSYSKYGFCLRSAGVVDCLWALCERYLLLLDCFNAIELSMICISVSRTPELARRCCLFEALLWQSSKLIPALSSAEVSCLMLTLTKVGLPAPHPIFGRLLCRAGVVCESMTDREIQNVFWSCANLGMSVEPLCLQALLSRVSTILRSISDSDPKMSHSTSSSGQGFKNLQVKAEFIATLMWSFGRIQICKSTSHVQELALQAVEMMRSNTDKRALFNSWQLRRMAQTMRRYSMDLPAEFQPAHRNMLKSKDIKTPVLNVIRTEESAPDARSELSLDIHSMDNVSGISMQTVIVDAGTFEMSAIKSEELHDLRRGLQPSIFCSKPIEGFDTGESLSSLPMSTHPTPHEVQIVILCESLREERTTRSKSRSIQLPPWNEEDIFAGHINCPCIPSHRLVIDVERGCNIQTCTNHSRAVHFCYFCKELAPFGGCGRCGGARRLGGLLQRVRQAISFTGKDWLYIRDQVVGANGAGLLDVLDEMIDSESLPWDDPSFAICTGSIADTESTARGWKVDALDQVCHCGSKGCRCGSELKAQVELARAAKDEAAELSLLRSVWKALVFGIGLRGGSNSSFQPSDDESDSDNLRSIIIQPVKQTFDICTFLPSSALYFLSIQST